jgi:uncharacterized phage infection (PIP) family protein YhgE
MISIVAYKIAVIVLVAGIVGASGTAVYYHDQQGTQISKSADLNTQIASLQNQINSLNSQVSQLNTQISQLQTLDNQLGANNGQLISQIQQLQTQVSQLQSHITQLESQITDLTAKLKLQYNRSIASQVTIWGSGSPLTSNQAFINLGTTYYSRYLRVSWTGAHTSFTIQVLDINITTPTATSGIYTVPISANATGNSWFTNYDCTAIPAGIICSTLTYSITYWY